MSCVFSDQILRTNKNSRFKVIKTKSVCDDLLKLNLYLLQR